MCYKTLILALCLTTVNGCKYFKNPGLLLNKFQDPSTTIVVNTNRYRNTATAFDALPVAQINFTYPINIMQDDQKNYFVRICENGYMEVSPLEANLAACKLTAADINAGAIAGLTNAIIIADFFVSTVASTNFQVEAYHMLRSDQLDASNNVTGPSYCDLQILAGIISDCQLTHRNNLTVYEALVVHWRITNGGTNYDFQSFIAVANDNRTFVGFIYESNLAVSGGNGVAKGIIHAKNDDLSSQQRYSTICDATTDTMLHMKSNCKCAQRGHYVFETTEMTTSPHGFCGTETGKDTCATTAALLANKKADPNVNRNCRTPDTPQESCDDTYHCLYTPSGSTQYTLNIYAKNYAGNDKAVFLNYTAFTAADGSTGYQAPYGENIQEMGNTPGFCVKDIALDSNDTFSNIPRLLPSLSISCFEFDSATNVFNFVVLLYNSVDGQSIYKDGSRIIVGRCDLDDLPVSINATLKAGDIAKTTVAPRTGQKLVFQFRDSRNETTSQTLTSSDTVQLGRLIYPTICYTPPAQYTPNVDAYGIYVTNCQFSNNKHFANDTGMNRTMDVVLDDGCLTSKPAVGYAGRLLEPFQIYPENRTEIVSPLCQTTSVNAFRWNINNPPSTLWMRCRVRFCVNTQLFNESKCFKSCPNTIVNSKPTDTDDSGRRKRDIEDEEEIELVTSIIVVDVEKPSEVSKDCADPAMAKSVIGALVALLIIATLMTIVLFVIFQKQKQC